MQPGDSLTFTYQEKQFKATFINEKDGQVTVKLANGYNMIVPKAELGNVHAESVARQPAAKPHIKQNPMLPHITILHTGGTIASKVDYKTGGTVAQFDPAELASLFPELLQIANISSHLLRNMQSDDMRFGHYNLIARAVLDEINKGAKGIIVTHGTDTLHYTSAALAFMLEGLNVPVVLVGSQRSSDRGSSDSGTNLIGAAQFIIQADVPGVFIAMHEGSDDSSIAIHDGLRCRKNHTTRRGAFAPINAPLFARIKDGRLELLDTARAAALKAAAARTTVHPFKEDLKVGWWRVHTQAFADELAPYDRYDGLLIEGTGLGHIPMTELDEFTGEHTKIQERIGELAKKMPVVIASQAIRGRVNLNVYSPQRILQGLGVIGAEDMHPETAFIKLAWLLSNHSKDETRKLFTQDLRGEIAARSPLEQTED